MRTISAHTWVSSLNVTVLSESSRIQVQLNHCYMCIRGFGFLPCWRQAAEVLWYLDNTILRSVKVHFPKYYSRYTYIISYHFIRDESLRVENIILHLFVKVYNICIMWRWCRICRMSEISIEKAKTTKFSEISQIVAYHLNSTFPDFYGLYF